MTAKKKTADAELSPEEQAAADAAAARELGIEELRGRLGDQVTIFPLEGVFISDVEHVEQTVDAERALDLLGYSPPAFTTVKPAEAVIVGESGPETVVVPQPSGDAGATPQEA